MANSGRSTGRRCRGRSKRLILSVTFHCGCRSNSLSLFVFRRGCVAYFCHNSFCICWNKLPGVAASATEWVAFAEPLASGDNTIVNAPTSNKCCCNTFGMDRCKEGVGNTWDAALDFVDKLGFSTFPNMLDNASLPYPALFRLRGPAPDTMPLLILRATALLSPSVPIMCTFEPHDVAPGQIARPHPRCIWIFWLSEPDVIGSSFACFRQPDCYRALDIYLDRIDSGVDPCCRGCHAGDPAQSCSCPQR